MVWFLVDYNQMWAVKEKPDHWDHNNKSLTILVKNMSIYTIIQINDIGSNE